MNTVLGFWSEVEMKYSSEIGVFVQLLGIKKWMVVAADKFLSLLAKNRKDVFSVDEDEAIV